jgi:UDP-N-acetylglucosamine 1-carboxyvinyltransferase
MDKILIRGGNPLSGHIPISGAKNAALKLMAASLLTDQEVVLSNMPNLADTRLMIELLRQFGVETTDFSDEPRFGQTLHLKAANITSTLAPYELVRRMRASFSVFGPILARTGEARVSLPGGCAIGARPVDLHIKALEAMGAQIELADGYVNAKAPGGLRGAEVDFPFVSVGATENALMAATLADGETILRNAAQEPEIGDLADCLVAMGADIKGIGASTLTIRGVSKLGGTRHPVVMDRIETGTYAMAVALTGGELTLAGATLEHIAAAADTLEQAGVEVTSTNEGLRVARNGMRLKAIDVTTEPFPGFPTDLQAQFMALMSLADGTSNIRETIFENRFMHVPELNRMGADISVDGQTAQVKGVKSLKGAPVMATDLRASVSLVLAGLAATGETEVNRVYHLDRGFERIEEKLGACGADIRRVTGH